MMNLFNLFWNQGIKMQQMMQQMMRDPRGAIQQAGRQIPEEMMGDPQQMVMHLINSGQVSGPALQRIMPMIRQLGGR